MKRMLLALLLVQGAEAGELSGLIEAGYNQSTIDGSDYRTIGGGGSLMLPFGVFALQADAAAASYQADGNSVLSWSLGGDLMWRPRGVVVGLSAAYETRDNARNFNTGNRRTIYTLDYEGYQLGAFGEWYARSDLSLRARAGILSLNCGMYDIDAAGGYGGLGAEYYPVPDLGISGRLDYLSADKDYLGANRDVFRLGASAEYQVSDEVPLSVMAGYQYADGDLRDREAVNSFTIVLRYRFGTAGALVERDRAGPAIWNGLYLAAAGTGRPLHPTVDGYVICSLPGGRPC